MNRSAITGIIGKTAKLFFLSLGIFSFLLLVLSFTRVPYDVHCWLGTYDSQYAFVPDEIIFLGGSGMPSEANLLRLYHTAALGKKFPSAGIILTHPTDEDVLAAFRDELLRRGIDSARIRMEKKGTNTRDQAVHLAEDYPQLLSKKIVIVTSPENMLRTVRSFRKMGFQNVGGQSAFEFAMFVDLAYDFEKTGGKAWVPDVSDNLALRYNFWNYLKLEITCLREFFALGYYRLNSWI